LWRREKTRTVTSSLFLALLVTALGFTQIVYTGYIPGVQTAAADFGFGFQTLLSSILRTSPPVAYAWIPPATPYAILAVQVTWYLAISLPLIAVIYLRRNSRAMRGEPWRLIPLSTPILALALVWPVDAFAYASLGALAIGLFRFSTLGGLLLTVPATRELTQKGIPAFLRNRGAILPHSLAVLVVMLSAILLASASAQNIAISSQVLYADAKPAGFWLLEHQPGITFIYGDHNTQGQFAIDAARIGENFVSSNLFTETSYAAILGRPAQNVSFLTGEYVAVNLQLARFKTSAGGWVDFEALSGHLTEIKSNPELALIYDDGNVWILTGLADDTYPPQP